MGKPIPALGRPPLTSAVFHILLALADGPLHGYAIMQAVEKAAGAEMRMGPGTIYGSLQRMEEAVSFVSTPRAETTVVASSDFSLRAGARSKRRRTD